MARPQVSSPTRSAARTSASGTGQARPLDDDDALPGFRRDRRGEVMAFADRQVTEPPPGVTRLADVERDAAADVHAIHDRPETGGGLSVKRCPSR